MVLADDYFEQFRRQLCESLDRPRPVQKEVLPTHRLDPQPLDGNRLRLIAQQKRVILPITGDEFGETAKVGSPDRPRLHFDRPLAQRPFENRINLERFLAPVAHLLPHIPCMRETRILNPGAESRRLSIPVGNTPRIDNGEERVAQRHELGWSGTAARGSRGVSRDGRDEKSLFEKREVVGDLLRLFPLQLHWACSLPNGPTTMVRSRWGWNTQQRQLYQRPSQLLVGC
jgi:hypothetical protein